MYIFTIYAMYPKEVNVSPRDYFSCTFLKLSVFRLVYCELISSRYVFFCES